MGVCNLVGVGSRSRGGFGCGWVDSRRGCRPVAGSSSRPVGAGRCWCSGRSSLESSRVREGSVEEATWVNIGRGSRLLAHSWHSRRQVLINVSSALDMEFQV